MVTAGFGDQNAVFKGESDRCLVNSYGHFTEGKAAAHRLGAVVKSG